MEKPFELTLINNKGEKVTKSFKDGYSMYMYAIQNRPKWAFELPKDNGKKTIPKDDSES